MHGCSILKESLRFCAPFSATAKFYSLLMKRFKGQHYSRNNLYERNILYTDLSRMFLPRAYGITIKLTVCRPYKVRAKFEAIYFLTYYGYIGVPYKKMVTRIING